MNPLFEAAGEVCGFMSQREWEYCIIGGLAVLKWGEPRDWLDAQSIVFRQSQSDNEYILARLAELCELKVEHKDFDCLAFKEQVQALI